MKRNREQKARARLISFLKIKKEEQRILDEIAIGYGLSYRALYVVSTKYDKFLILGNIYGLKYRDSRCFYIKYDVEDIREAYKDIIRRRIKTIPIKYIPTSLHLQGTSSTWYEPMVNIYDLDTKPGIENYGSYEDLLKRSESEVEA